MPNGKKNGKTFSVTEVGTLVESLRGDISVIAEDLVSVKNDVSELKTDVHELKTDMKLVKDVIRVAIPSMNVRITYLEAKAGA